MAAARIWSAARTTDCGERYYCRDCGASGDVDDTVPALRMLPQPTHKPMTPAPVPTGLPEVACCEATHRPTGRTAAAR